MELLILPSPSPMLGIHVWPTVLAAGWVDLEGRTPTILPIGAQVQGSGQSAAFPWAPSLGYLLLEARGWEWGCLAGKRNRDCPPLSASRAELPGPICGENTSVSSLLPLSRPKVSGIGPGLWPLLWSGSGPAWPWPT